MHRHGNIAIVLLIIAAVAASAFFFYRGFVAPAVNNSSVTTNVATSDDLGVPDAPTITTVTDLDTALAVVDLIDPEQVKVADRSQLDLYLQEF